MNHNKALLVANWKMHKTTAEAKSFIEKLESSDVDHENIVICPPFSLQQYIKDSPFALGAQDCSALHFDQGAFTGDISCLMLKDSGCKYVIIGHSERRKYHQESAEKIKTKMTNAHLAGLIAIICIGEDEAQRDAGNYLSFLLNQLEECSANSANKSNTIIAYEPIWAVGSGKCATIEQITEVHQHLAIQGYNILYGGSVSPSNAKEILLTPNMFGLLIGNASLDVNKFREIIKIREGICN